MKKSLSLNLSATLGILFFVILFSAIFMESTIFDFIVSETGADAISQSQSATKQTTDLLLSLDKITLDTKVLDSTYLQSLNQLPSFPVDAQTVSNFGKTNPFSGSFIIVAPKATSSVGAVVYSNQRAVNGGNSVRAVALPSARGRTR